VRYFIPVFIVVVVSVVSILGFRGSLSKNTPIEVFPDMDRQAKFKSQTKNSFFNDNSADRLPVVGTAVRGNLIDQVNVFSTKPNFLSEEVKSGKNTAGEWLTSIPKGVDVDISLMRLGKEKYDIHCAICHGTYGNGLGVTSHFGLAPRNLSDASQAGTYLESAAPWTDGQIYNAISMGSASGIMLGLKDKLTPRERWAIVLYLRALQSYVSDATNQLTKGS
jgi:mono/diheme cytochrome c family protein